MCEGGSACLILHASRESLPWAKKKVSRHRGKLSQSPGGRDDDAGPLRQTRGTRKEKRQIEMSSADESTGLALAFVDRWAMNIGGSGSGSGSSVYWNCYN